VAVLVRPRYVRYVGLGQVQYIAILISLNQVCYAYVILGQDI